MEESPASVATGLSALNWALPWRCFHFLEVTWATVGSHGYYLLGTRRVTEKPLASPGHEAHHPRQSKIKTKARCHMSLGSRAISSKPLSAARP